MTSISGTILRATDFTIKGNKVYVKKNMTKGQIGMLLIHGDFCIHCKHFIPTFNEINQKIGNRFACVSIESKELEGQTALVSALDFQGYPTICFFDASGLIIGQYDGKRDTKSLLDTICKVYHHCVTK